MAVYLNCWLVYLLYLLHISHTQVRPASDLQDALQTLGLTKFLQKLKQAGLNHILYNADRYTLFAPTNEAFSRLEVRALHSSSGALGEDGMKELLLYHVAYSEWKSSDWMNEQLIPTALAGMNIRVNMYEPRHARKGSENVLTVCGVQVVSADNKAGNGIVHVLNDLIYPMASASLYDTLSSIADLSRFKSLLDEANMMAMLKYQEPLTVFAPINDAFKKLPPQFMDSMSSQVTAMAAILNYHIVNGTYFSLGLFRNTRLHSMESSDITVAADAGESIDHTTKLNGDAVILRSYPTTNGVLHLVDTLLLPPASPKQMYYSVKEGVQYDKQFRRK